MLASAAGIVALLAQQAAYAYISPSQVFGGASASQNSSTPLPFGDQASQPPLPFGAATSEPPLPFGASSSIPLPFDPSSSSSVSSSSSSSSSVSSSSSSSAGTSGGTGGIGGSTSGTSGGSTGGHGGNSGGAGGGGGTGGGSSTFIPPDQQNGPDYVRTFYTPPQAEASGFKPVDGTESGGPDNTIEGTHDGAAVTSKPVVQNSGQGSYVDKAAQRAMNHVPRNTSSGPTEVLAFIALCIAAAATLLMSVRRATSLIPQ